MSYIAIDTETHLIAPGLVVPPLVVMSWATEDATDLVAREDAGAVLDAILTDKDITIIGHNLAFDLCVLANGNTSRLCAVFEAYHEGRCLDTAVFDKLIHIRIGILGQTQFHLSDLTKRYLGEVMEKGADTWRLRYRELEAVPLAQWPEEATRYARLDAINTLRAFLAMRERFPDYPPHEEIVRQSQADFALHLMRATGIMADPVAVEKLRKTTQATIDQYEQQLISAGILQRKKTPKVLGIAGEKLAVNQARVRALVTAAYNGAPPMTGPSKRHPQGQVAIARATLEQTTDPDLLALAHRGKATKLLEFVGILSRATEHPLNPRWNVLVSTGRTSCGNEDDPGNLQNQPRAGGVRECFVPAPGNVFITSDYDCAELRALAQVCYSKFGFSAMRDVFLTDKDDPHQALADAFPDIVPSRQFAKIPNFGFPGGLGADTFIQFARGYGCDGKTLPVVTKAQAQALKRAWLNMWPEMVPYFEYITHTTGDFSEGTITQLFSERIRGNVNFCSAANSLFQGLVGDGGKSALYAVTTECFVESDSPLYGYRPVAFIHDEIIIEGPNNPERASAAAGRLSEVMVAVMESWLPDVPVKSTAAMMRRWYKGAKPVRSPEGLLIPWEPKQ